MGEGGGLCSQCVIDYCAELSPSNALFGHLLKRLRCSEAAQTIFLSHQAAIWLGLQARIRLSFRLASLTSLRKGPELRSMTSEFPSDGKYCIFCKDGVSLHLLAELSIQISVPVMLS